MPVHHINEVKSDNNKVLDLVNGTYDGSAILTGSITESQVSDLGTYFTQADANTLTGVSATNLGTFTGATISDSASIKAALQSLETALEATSGTATTLSSGQSTLQTLCGSSTGDLGTFSGSTITASGAVKDGMQELETAVELKANTSTVTGLIAGVNSAIAAVASDLADFESTHEESHTEWIIAKNLGPSADGTTTASFGTLAAGTYIMECRVIVNTAYDTAATFTIGTTADPDSVITSSLFDITSASPQPETRSLMEEVTTGAAYSVTVSEASATAGDMDVAIQVVTPAS